MKMKYYIFASLSVIGLLSLSPLVQANPSQGYCQTVDGSVCGWGGNSSSYKPQYWYAGVAYDPKNGIFSIYTATSRELAMRSAAKECKQINENQRRCSELISSVSGYTKDKEPGTVITKGQLPDGTFQLNLRYGLNGQKTFFQSNSYSEKNAEVIGMEDCVNKYKLSNCEIVYKKYTTF